MRMSFYCLLGGIFCHLGCYRFFLDMLGTNMVSLHKMSLCPHQSVHPCQIRISHIVFCTFRNLSKSFISPAHCHRLLVWHETQAQNEKSKIEKTADTATIVLLSLVSANKICLISTTVLLARQRGNQVYLVMPYEYYQSWNILYLPISVSRVHYGNSQRNILLSNGYKRAITTWY